jgi:hypothetical protein
MKWLKRIGLGLILLIVVLVVVFNIWRAKFLKAIIETEGPAVLGVSVKVESIDYHLFRGLVQVKGFVLGNPQGFKAEKSISVGEITVEFVPKTILSDTVIIKRVYVNAPDITYEVGLGKSNIGRLLENIGGPEAAKKKEAPPEPAAAKKSGGKKVIIEDLLVENGHVRLSSTLAGGAAAPIALPTVHMTNVGKEEEGGASVTEVVKKVLGEVFGTVTHVATGAAGAVGDTTGKMVRDVKNFFFGKGGTAPAQK